VTRSITNQTAYESGLSNGIKYGFISKRERREIISALSKSEPGSAAYENTLLDFMCGFDAGNATRSADAAMKRAARLAPYIAEAAEIVGSDDHDAIEAQADELAGEAEKEAEKAAEVKAREDSEFAVYLQLKDQAAAVLEKVRALGWSSTLKQAASGTFYITAEKYDREGTGELLGEVKIRVADHAAPRGRGGYAGESVTGVEYYREADISLVIDSAEASADLEYLASKLAEIAE
jgi:hypothetical protein